MYFVTLGSSLLHVDLYVLLVHEGCHTAGMKMRAPVTWHVHALCLLMQVELNRVSSRRHDRWRGRLLHPLSEAAKACRCMHIRASHTFLCAHIHTHIYIYIHTCLCVCARMCVRMYACTYTHAFVYLITLRPLLRRPVSVLRADTGKKRCRPKHIHAGRFLIL